MTCSSPVAADDDPPTRIDVYFEGGFNDFDNPRNKNRRKHGSNFSALQVTIIDWPNLPEQPEGDEGTYPDFPDTVSFQVT
jgi:hypothetical protein